MMDKKMIEQWAREAGGWLDNAAESDSGSPVWLLDSADLERFAALVAAHEREQCALVCEEVSLQAVTAWKLAYQPQDQGREMGADECEHAIRARGEVSQKS